MNRLVTVAHFKKAFDTEPRHFEVRPEALLRRVTTFRVREDLVREAFQQARDLGCIADDILGGREPSVGATWRRTKALQHVAQTSPASDRERAVRAKLDELRAQCTPKHLAPRFAMARFREGFGKKKVAVEYVSGLLLDIDAGATPEQVAGRFAGHPRAVYTSSSFVGVEHGWRFRCVVPLAQDIPAHLWPRAWRWIERELDGAVDKQTKDVNRQMIEPVVWDKAAPRWSSTWDLGAPLFDLDVHALPPAPEEANPGHNRAMPGPIVAQNEQHREAEVRRRLKFEPAVRLRLAEALGAKVEGSGVDQRATEVPCPACSRPSAWFYVEPRRWRGAKCDHRSSCGWEGQLLDLARGVA